jgi:hypothetical protein
MHADVFSVVIFQYVCSLLQEMWCMEIGEVYFNMNLGTASWKGLDINILPVMLINEYKWTIYGHRFDSIGSCFLLIPQFVTILFLQKFSKINMVSSIDKSLMCYVADNFDRWDVWIACWLWWILSWGLESCLLRRFITSCYGESKISNYSAPDMIWSGGQMGNNEKKETTRTVLKKSHPYFVVPFVSSCGFLYGTRRIRRVFLQYAYYSLLYSLLFFVLLNLVRVSDSGG